MAPSQKSIDTIVAIVINAKNKEGCLDAVKAFIEELPIMDNTRKSLLTLQGALEGGCPQVMSICVCVRVLVSVSSACVCVYITICSVCVHSNDERCPRACLPG